MEEKTFSTLEELHTFLNEKRGEDYPMHNGFCCNDLMQDDLICGNFDTAHFTIPRDLDGMYGRGADEVHVTYTGPTRD